MRLAAVRRGLGGERKSRSTVDPFLVGAQGCSGWVMRWNVNGRGLEGVVGSGICGVVVACGVAGYAIGVNEMAVSGTGTGAGGGL